MNKMITFRHADETDFDMILNLEKESFNRYDRLDLKTLNELFSEFREGFYIILADGVIAGYSVFLVEDGAGYIESIAISKNYRRCGFGLITLRFIMSRIADMSINRIDLHVRFDNNAAMALYEKVGFVRKKIVEGFYTDGESAYLYSFSFCSISENNSVKG